MRQGECEGESVGRGGTGRWGGRERGPEKKSGGNRERQ